MNHHYLHFSINPITKSTDLFLWDWFRFSDISRFLELDLFSLSRYGYRASRDALSLFLPKEVNYAICLKEKALFGDCTSPLKLEKTKKLNRA